MVTTRQRAAFDGTGVVRLPGAVSAVDAERMSDEVWAFLAARTGIVKDDPSTWSPSRPSGFNPLARTGVFDRLWSPMLSELLGEVFAGASQSRERERVLMTFPQPEETWDVPSAGWHFDFTPLQGRPGLRAVQVFALLSRVEPGGGGTLVLTGSHQLVSRYVATTGQQPKPAVVREALGVAHPWLQELWSGQSASTAPDRVSHYLGQPAIVDGIELRVLEITGEPGDVLVMNSDCFHATTSNSLSVPRIMLTSLVTRADR